MISIKNFKIIALLEGISYILLLFVATPLKHLLGVHFLVRILGMPHGILFIAYVLFAFLLKDEQKWPTKDFIIILICSLLPFGTFYVDKKYLRS